MSAYNQDTVYREWVAITPSDLAANNLPAGVNGIYVGGAGNIAMVSQDGATVVFTAVPVGTLLRCGPLRINSTSTTATLLVALF